MSRWIAILGAVALFGAGCGIPEEYEGEEAVSQDAQAEAALQGQPPGDVGVAVTCQPGTFVNTCYDSGGCYENAKCGTGCRTYSNWKCKQYKVTISGVTYYYRQECNPTAVLSCGSALSPKCQQTCT